ncbi:MAG: Zn-dependent oligopeptidase [Sphingomonadales bacterium]|nr:Zn-dependent oligopeptidase [Sphingomonadales bacterium]
MRHLLLLPSLFALVAAQAPASVDSFLAQPDYTPASAAEVKAMCDSFLGRAAAMRRTLEAQRSAPSLATLGQYDDLMHVLSSLASDAGLLAEVAPDEPRREAGRACQSRAGEAYDAIQLSRVLYDRLKAIPLDRASPEARHVLTRALQGFDRAGVSRDEATRAKVAALKKEITDLGLRFDANIANGRKTITADPAELDGLPADYIAAHKPGPDGKVVISTDTPDYSPVMNYARSEALRKRLYEANLTRAWPANDEILRALFTKRDELARLLGRPNSATLELEDKMIGTPEKALAFLADAGRAGESAAKRDYERMVRRLAADQPGATQLTPWSSGYVTQLIRKESYALDPQEVRRYFAYNNVRDGMLQLTRDLMGVEIRPWKTPVWDPSVEAYEMLDKGKVIGRFYFDTHPRPGKYSHANVVPLRSGIRGRILPTAALVTNFPAGDHKTGLMEHRDVETFLHEYGHLIHVLMAGQQDYALSGPLNLEWDFIEAPSQMLENFVWDYDTLARFAVDADGKTIPRELVGKMNRARYFGEALGDRRQYGLANVSLSYHLGLPEADLTGQYAKAYDAYGLPQTPADVHPQASFGHLNGYSAFYYTYMWSKTISTDLFTRFKQEGLRNPAVARAYREKVLEPGSSKPAAALVQDFLGRPFSLDAYKARLNEGE